ncbi:MAG: hypothetical protein PHE43_04010 [Candidatus Nanoarchaeia archaeon]|nr:hypothetical protein [Candidatus Nanoarchaeia archaeon]
MEEIFEIIFFIGLFIMIFTFFYFEAFNWAALMGLIIMLISMFRELIHLEKTKRHG